MFDTRTEMRKMRMTARSVQRRARRLGRLRPPRLEFPYRAPTVPKAAGPVPKPEGRGVDYDTDWARTDFARVVRAAAVESIVRPTVRVLAQPERIGLDRLDDIDGPVIFAANHHSHLDTPLIATSIPAHLRHHLVVGAAADYFFSNPVTSAASALFVGAIPIERSKVGRTSADEAARILDEGWSLLIYPEGGRSPDGWAQEFRGGAAYLALRCGVPVIPVHLSGTGRILRKGSLLPRPARTTVAFGAPVVADDGERSRGLATRIEIAVSSLADEVATDWWQARRRFHAGDVPSMSGPAAASWRRAWQLGSRDRSRRNRRPAWPRI
ncbi:MAG: lysophospholipid acyltransferase family protein [Acidimicrobiales bacterium]